MFQHFGSFPSRLTLWRSGLEESNLYRSCSLFYHFPMTRSRIHTDIVSRRDQSKFFRKREAIIMSYHSMSNLSSLQWPCRLESMCEKPSNYSDFIWSQYKDAWSRTRVWIKSPGVTCRQFLSQVAWQHLEGGRSLKNEIGKVWLHWSTGCLLCSNILIFSFHLSLSLWFIHL